MAILLLPGNAKALMAAIKPDPLTYGWLLTPRRTMTQTGLFGLPYAVDNECFTLGDKFDSDRFIRALIRIMRCHGAGGCLFVVAPDVIENAVETLKQFSAWRKTIYSMGFSVALAAQDGLEHLEIPWCELDALFIGGSTQWKLSEATAEIVTEAKSRNKWVHMARVNSVYRASRFCSLVDSVDGTAWAKHPTEYALQWQRWIDAGRPSFVGRLI